MCHFHLGYEEKLIYIRDTWMRRRAFCTKLYNSISLRLGEKPRLRSQKIFCPCSERYLIIQLGQKSKYKCQRVHKIDVMHTVSLNISRQMLVNN